MRKYIFLILFTHLFFSLNAQPELKFTRYTSQQGLINDNAFCIYQDCFGFLWFGTSFGCSRFDGIEFKNYLHRETASGPIELGQVNQIVGDSEGNLWLATVSIENSSIIKYDYNTDKFEDISPIIKEQLHVKGNILNFWNIFLDSDGYLWFTLTNYGPLRYNPNNQTIKIFDPPIPKPQTPNSFFEDIDKNIWMATLSGAVVYNKKTDSFTHYKHNPENEKSLSHDNCTKIFQDSEKQIWISTYNGLNKLIPSHSNSPTFEHYLHNPQNPFTLSNNLIYDIIEDNNKRLLIATVNGLCLLEKKSGNIYRYFSDETDKESINSNLVRTLYRDNQQNVWIATNSGIGKTKVNNFKSFSQSFYKNSISHNKVQYLCEAPNSDIWIATPKGIDVFDRKKEEFRFIAGVSQDEKGLYGAPLTFYPDDNEGMWIGTWNGSFSRFDLTTTKIKNYILEAPWKKKLSVMFIFEDSKDNLWVGASANGVYVYNKKTKKHNLILQNSENDNTISSNRFTSILEDSDSDIWIGTLKGLNLLLDIETGSFKCYLNEVEIKHIVEGADKNLWIATDNGLYQFNKKTQKFKNYNVTGSKLDKSVSSILIDSSQNLWLTVKKSLIKFRLLSDSIPEITTFHNEELAVGGFINRSCAKLSDGTMLFGGTEGFCMFHPQEIKIDTLPPKVVFTSLSIANKPVKTGQIVNGQIILPKSIEVTKQLKLNHKNNTFTIKFAGLQYNTSQHNQYCYRLEGYDPIKPKWYYTKSGEREAEYINLPGGHYVLKVKAANSHGNWNNQPVELKIDVFPPWWQTIWFISLAILSLVLLFILIVRLRTHNLQKQKQKLEKIVEQRTTELKEMNIILQEGKEELESQMEQMAKMNESLEAKTLQIENIAKQLHEADQSKLRFFANVSHEFRTPLSLIIAPLEKLSNLEQPIFWNKINISDYHQLMLKNSKRLLRLINQVIDFRKIEQGGKQLNISNNNIVEFTKEIIAAFSTLAEQKNISLKMESQYPVIDFMFDPDVLEKILYNLISNAIKYTPKEGEVSIQLSVNNEQSTVNSNQSADNEELIINNEKLDNKNTNDNKFTIHNSSFLIIKVSDTGIGMSKENLDKIFDRFYRIDTQKNLAEEGGTGIGLSYTKELIGLHKGSISVESELHKGTTFTVQFPIDKEIYGNKINIKDRPPNLNYIHSMIDPVNDNTDETNIEKTNINTDEIINDDLQNKRPNILVVEDNTDLRKFIKNELSPHFNVYEALNGKEGLDLATRIEPELIVSDIMMPIMNGIELCRKIKTNEDTSHIPIILLTAKGSEEDQVEGLKTGADDYITKPFNINILKIKINNSFQLRKQIQKKFSQSIDIVPSEITHSQIDQHFLQKAIEIVNNNMGDYEFSIDAFVTHMNYSRRLVYKKIKNITGQSVSEFIYSIRLKAAARLFIEGHTNIKEVSYKVGFKHPNTFSEYFRKMFGKPPSIFIKEVLKK